MKKNLQLLVAAVAVVIMAFNLESCTSYRGLASMPDGHNRYRPDFAMRRIAKHHHNDGVKNTTVAVNQTPAAPKPESKFVAEIKGDAPFKARIPKLVAKQIDDDKMVKVNDALARYSDNKVSLVKTSSGKMVLKAASRNDFQKLTKTLIQASKAVAPISDEVKDILALVAGICGIVSIALCLIPWANYLSFPTGIAGIVLGALSLHSENRHKWALLGIILGAIGVFLAIVMTAVYIFFLYGAIL